MKKRLFAALTALCCAGSMTLPMVSAETQYVTNDSGALLLPPTSAFYVIVETNGTELTLETVEEFGKVSIFYELDEWISEGWNAWPSGSVGEYSFIPENTENAYIMCFYGGSNGAVTASRQMSLELTDVTDVAIMEAITYQKAYVDLDSLTITLKDIEADLSEEDMPEFAGCQFTENTYNNTWRIASQTAKISKLLEEMGLFDSTHYSTLTEYERYLYSLEICDALCEKYSDLVTSIEIGIECPETFGVGADEYASPYVWSTAGDHNADGEVNSNDAADLLVQAAQDGVAEASETTVSPDSDVNLDGVADSTDAAYILQYAALKGSGADADWVEILRK